MHQNYSAFVLCSCRCMSGSNKSIANIWQCFSSSITQTSDFLSFMKRRLRLSVIASTASSTISKLSIWLLAFTHYHYYQNTAAFAFCCFASFVLATNHAFNVRFYLLSVLIYSIQMQRFNKVV